MKFNLKTIIYSFFIFVGSVHISQLFWWYSVVMSDYYEIHKKITLSFKTDFKQKVLTSANLCGDNSATLSNICPQCTSIFKTDISDKITDVQIVLHKKVPVLLQITWRSDVGFIKNRYAEFDFSKELESSCGNKNEK